MKVKIKVEKEVELVTLLVVAGVRNWEDTEVNGFDDENGDLIPFRVDGRWCPIINIDSGIIKDWPQGTTAKVHYKICDDGSYFLRDETDKVFLSIKKNYVPEMMCPKGYGYGDYIIMDIDENGLIADWEPSKKGFK